jgi:hypothetical protein
VLVDILEQVGMVAIIVLLLPLVQAVAAAADFRSPILKQAVAA